jgi:hypothetical protein
MRFTSESSVVSRNDAHRAPGWAEGAHSSCGLGSPSGRSGGATRSPRYSHAGIPAALAALLITVACEPYVEGNGVYREEDRTGSVGTFVGIHAEDGIIATVTSHTAAYRLIASGDSNVLQYIRTEVQQDTVLGVLQPILHVWVDLSAGYSSTNPSAVVVDAPDLVYALAKHNARVDVTGAETAILTARAESGGNVSVVGPHVIDPEGDPAGAAIHVFASNGSVDAHRYVTTDATQAAYVELSAGARLQLHADGPVLGTATGASTVDNLAGTGSCAGVDLSGGATAACNPP